MSLQKLPREITTGKQFVVWKYGKDGSGNPTKHPYTPHSPQWKAKSNDSKTWSTFKKAAEVANTDCFQGVGRVLTEADPYTVVDLDHCRNSVTGEIKLWAWEIILKLKSYTEISPSGEGVHIWLKVDLKSDIKKCKKGDVEIFFWGFYLTMTGQHLEGTPTSIGDRQAELTALYTEIFGQEKKEAPKGPGPSPTLNLSDSEIIAKARAAQNGDKFDRLMRGDLSNYNEDDSRADLALCSILAFWTQDPAQIDRIFRTSKLKRDKWNRKTSGSTYGRITIDKALANIKETYKGPRRTKDKGNRAKTKPPLEADGKAQNPEGEAPQEAQQEQEAGLPVIRVNNRQLRDTTAEAIDALHAANDPPELFVRLGLLCRIQADEDGRPFIENLSEAGLRHYLTMAADFKSENRKSVTKVSPPKDLVQNIMAAPSWPFTPLRGIVEVPILRPNGSILATPGYDRTTKLFYRPVPGLDGLSIPESPSRNEAMQAARFINNDLFHDFPFADEASRANAYAACLTPFVRHKIKNHVPMNITDAPSPGSGKTLFAEVISQISTGRPAAMLSAPIRRDSDEEWSKVITSALLSGSTVIILDNCDGIIRSPSLAMTLTANVYSGRILGTNRLANLPIHHSWFANGNNIRLGGDLPRRCYWVRLDAKMSRPWERDGFKHSNLREWVMENRRRLVVAFLTIVRAWFHAGQPSPDSPILGSYEDWCRTVGGILQFAGIQGFLGNLEEMYDKTDEESREWEGFLLAWRGLYGDAVILVKDLIRDLLRDDGALFDALPGNLAEAFGKKGGSLARTLGWALGKKEGVHFGDMSLHLVRVPKADLQTKANGWQVVTY